MNENFNKINLTINNDDSDIKTYQYFLDTLYQEYNKFVSNKKIITKEWEEINKDLKELDGKFIPEELYYNSPKTIIDAPWGVGKTYFMEQLVKNIHNGKLDFSNFSRIYKIDAIQFFDGENGTSGIYDFFVKKILKIDNVDSKKIRKWFNSHSHEFSIGIGGLLSFSYKISDKKQENKNEDFFKVIEKYDEIILSLENKPMIIFIDNIERIENDYWLIIREIHRFSRLQNMIIIFNINSKALKDKNENREWSMTKFIDIVGFTLETGLKKITDDNMIIIDETKDKIFKSMIDYSKITATNREYKNILIFHNENYHNNMKKEFNSIYNALSFMNSTFGSNVIKISDHFKDAFNLSIEKLNMIYNNFLYVVTQKSSLNNGTFLQWDEVSDEKFNEIRKFYGIYYAYYDNQFYTSIDALKKIFTECYSLLKNNFIDEFEKKHPENEEIKNIKNALPLDEISELIIEWLLNNKNGIKSNYMKGFRFNNFQGGCEEKFTTVDGVFKSISINEFLYWTINEKK